MHPRDGLRSAALHTAALVMFLVIDSVSDRPNQGCRVGTTHANWCRTVTMAGAEAVVSLHEAKQ